MAKQFILITDKDGQQHQIPDFWLSSKIRHEYANLPPLQAWSKAIGDWISIERAKGEAEHKGERA